MNTIKTGLLLAAVGAAAVAIGSYFFGPNGAVIGLGLAFAFQAFSLFSGHKIALRFAHAEPLPPGSLPWYEQAAERLSQRAGIPTPKLYISPDPQPNAFAAGWKPDVAVVNINQGLLNVMSRDEVIAVLAHEIAHIRNRDTLTMTVVAAMGSFVTFLANFAWLLPRGEDSERNPFVDLLMMILAPIAMMIAQMAVSRTREFAADRTAAELMGNATPMMNALAALDRSVDRVPSLTAQPATAHMYIASPMLGGLGKLFSTHPPIADRINALRQFRGAVAA